MNDKDLPKKLDLKSDFAFYVHGWLGEFNIEKEGTYGILPCFIEILTGICMH